MTIEQKRRELFLLRFKNLNLDSFSDEDGDSVFHDDLTQGAWIGFNAALDAVEIELPETVDAGRDKYGEMQLFDLSAEQYQDNCRAAIESTGLGIKVKS